MKLPRLHQTQQRLWWWPTIFSSQRHKILCIFISLFALDVLSFSDSFPNRLVLSLLHFSHWIQWFFPIFSRPYTTPFGRRSASPSRRRRAWDKTSSWKSRRSSAIRLFRRVHSRRVPGICRNAEKTLYVRVSGGSSVRGFFILHDSSKKHGTECITKPGKKKNVSVSGKKLLKK